ncbi:MAG: pyridoxamine 5'-phosphate oxidase [Bacteroidales bacterium]|nr:pyridoxamine 5'-phosphate oxidase [Bacteroidales bacterium]
MSSGKPTKEPFSLFGKWYEEMLASPSGEPTAMILATASADGRVSSRVVLLKGYNESGLYFFTNYNSHKAMQLESNNHAALLFYWPNQGRQVRIEGRAYKITEEESDAYFITRPTDSRLGAWASEQSSPIESQRVIEERVSYFRNRFGDNIPRPPHWGGYVIAPVMFEFWEEGEHRLHSRLVFNRTEDGWKTVRLAP